MLTCLICNVSSPSMCNFRTHLASKKHIKNLEKHHANLNNNNKELTTNKQNNEPLNNSTQFNCKYCSKILSSKFNLKRHFKTCDKTNSVLDTLNNNLLNQLATPNTEFIINPLNTNINNNFGISTVSELTLPPKGIVYFIQPVELIGTGRYKIGHSSKTTLERCNTGYKKGSRYINIQECFEPFKLETKLKLEFKNKFTLIGGTEYFAGNEQQMKKLFNDTCDLHDSAYNIFYNNPTINVPLPTTIKSQPETIIPTNNTPKNQNTINIPSIEIENIIATSRDNPN